MSVLLDDPVGRISLLIGVMSGVTVLLLVAAFTGGTPRQLRRRILQVSARGASPRPHLPAPRGARPISRRRPSGRSERLLRLLPRRATLVQRLGKTGRNITLAQYIGWTIATVLAATLLLVVAARLGLLASLLAGAAIGLLVPHYIVGRMGRQRVARFIALFPEAIDLMVRALRAGLPVTEAIINAGQEVGDPVGTELRGIEAGMTVGRDLDSLLWDIAKRITAPEFRFFIIALSVQRETGGNLAETLNNLSDVLRRRRAMRAKARAMAGEARASTVILGSLPVFVAGIMSLTSPAYVAPLVTDMRGLLLVGLAVLMQVTGIAIMVKMARFEI
ncbi:MAG: type II secretion system F family protein [Alphaproteobacteria bacterium]